MKEIKYFVLTVGLSLMCLSCEDYLDENIIDSVSVDYIYSSPEGLETGVNALYNLHREYNYPSRTGDGFRVWIFFRLGTDLGLCRTFIRPYHPDQMNALNFQDIYWTQAYQIVDRANAIIGNAQNIEMDESQRNEILAQARAIRGEVYFNLLRAYDNILLDTEATTSDNVFEDQVFQAANKADVYEVIDADLDFAIQHLDWENDYGKFGKAAVHHVRGQSAMWQGDWAEAVENFDAVINSGLYALTDIENVFAQNANHEESLMVFPRDEALGGDDVFAGGDYHQFPGMFVARWYEIPTGEVIRTVENGGQTMGWGFPNDYLKSLYDQANDKRFSNYYYPEQLFINNPEDPNFGQPLPAESYPDNFRQYHWSLKKYHDINKPIDGNTSYKDLIKYRYAETLLLGAEAHWRNSGENATNAKALEYINLVRDRAGLLPFGTFDLDSYLEESARELSFEGNRWNLLKRLGLLVERQNLYYRRGGNSGNVGPEPMEPHMVNLPIPQSQIDLLETFPQNEGYQ